MVILGAVEEVGLVREVVRDGVGASDDPVFLDSLRIERGGGYAPLCIESKRCLNSTASGDGVRRGRVKYYNGIPTFGGFKLDI
jgi:hypothetical protein